MPTPITPIEAAPVVPDSSLDEPEFDPQQEDFYVWEKDKLGPGANALAQATYANAMEALAAAQAASNSAESASALSNFKGSWASLTEEDELVIGDSVEDQGTIWVALVDLPDVTLSRPGEIDGDWFNLEGYFSPGDLLTTVRALTAPAWLQTDGAVYSIPAYPVLASHLPTAMTPPTYKLPAPASLPAGGNGATFSKDGQYLVMASGTAPYIAIYKRDGDTFTKLPNPASMPASSCFDAAFSPDGVYLAIAGGATPFVTIYKRDGDTFTKLPNPAALPANYANGCSFSHDGQYLAVVHGSTPFVTIYKRNGDDFTKLANPASLPASESKEAAWSLDDTYLAIAHITTPFVTIYKRTGDTFAKLANPATLPGSDCSGVAFSPDGIYLAFSHASTPYVTIYKRSGDTFTKLANPASLPTGGGLAVAFSPDGVYLAVGVSGSPYVTVYKRSGDVFTKEPDMATLPSGNGTSVAYFKGTTNFEYMLAVSTLVTPFIHVYRDAYPYDPRIEFRVPNFPGVVGDPAKTYIRA